MLNYSTITVRFLISGHTNNRCDGAFGLFKQRLKSGGVNFPSEMMACMDDSWTSVVVIGELEVHSVNWNVVLNEHFIVPVKLKTNSYIIFQAH